MTLGKLLVVSGVLCGVMVGLYLIALITPKLAAYIDKLMGKSPDPYGGVPNPARVEEDAVTDPTSSDEEEEK